MSMFNELQASLEETIAIKQGRSEGIRIDPL